MIDWQTRPGSRRAPPHRFDATEYLKAYPQRGFIFDQLILIRRNIAGNR
jgi:hypothetical protein